MADWDNDRSDFFRHRPRAAVRARSGPPARRRRCRDHLRGDLRPRRAPEAPHRRLHGRHGALDGARGRDPHRRRPGRDGDLRRALRSRTPLRRHPLLLCRRPPGHLVGGHPGHLEAPVLAAHALDRPGRRRPHGARHGRHRPVGPRRPAGRNAPVAPPRRHPGERRGIQHRRRLAQPHRLRTRPGSHLVGRPRLVPGEDQGGALRLARGRPPRPRGPAGARRRRDPDVRRQPTLGPVHGQPDHAGPGGSRDGLGRGAVPRRRPPGPRPPPGVDPAGRGGR